MSKLKIGKQVKNETVDYNSHDRGKYKEIVKRLLELKIGYSLPVYGCRYNNIIYIASIISKKQKGNYRIKTRYIKEKSIGYIGKFEK